MDNWIITNITNALNKWNETLGQIINIITQSPQDFGGGSIWGVITNIHGALQAIGYSLLVLFFCMGIFKTAANVAELKRPEAAVKIFVRFACAKAAITYGMDILLALYSISQGILTTVARQLGSINAAANLPDDIAQAISEVRFIDTIPLSIVTLLGTIVIAILGVVMLVTVYGRFFRIFMFTAIAPIPLSTFAGEGTAQFGRSYLKAYAGVLLEGVIIVLACVIFSAFASSPADPVYNVDQGALQAVWDYIFSVVLNMVILQMTIRTADRVVKELMGL